MRTTNGNGGARRGAVVEAHVLQRRRAVELLGSGLKLQIAQSCGTIAELVAWMQRTARSGWPHVVVAELPPGPELDRDLSAIRTMREVGIRVVLLSSLDSRLVIRRALRAGVDGIVSKRDAEPALLDAVARVLGGASVVTPQAAAVIDADPMPRFSLQEARLLELYAGGASLSSAAERLGVREDTARKYLKRVKLKYGAQGRPAGSKLELAWRAWEDGLLDANTVGCSRR